MSADPPALPSRCQTAVYRILDANLNRGLEGLRVVEEYLRFVLNDRHLASVCKQLRHDLAECVAVIDTGCLHAARDVAGDVGTEITTSREYHRPDLQAVVAANVKRVQQSLRALEEYAKVAVPAHAPALESLRYRSYTLERSITLLQESLVRLDTAQLYVLVDGADSLDSFQRAVEVMLAAGVDVLQLRDKQLSDRELLARARVLKALTSSCHTLFIMNDRVDLAVLAEADGVHVGQEELTVAEARRIIGPDRLIGVSTHSLAQARQAVLDGADYLGCGPTFPSSTKSFGQYAGVEFLRQVADEIRLPAFAIGGINEENVSQVRAAGFHRIAVSHSVVKAAAPAAAVCTLRTLLGS